MSYIPTGEGDRSDVRSPTSTRSDVRSPTSTRSDVRSPTSTRTEVRSPTSTSTDVRSPTSTSTDAYTSGNVTVTGGAGAGATTSVTICPGSPYELTPAARSEHQAWIGSRMSPVARVTPSNADAAADVDADRRKIDYVMSLPPDLRPMAYLKLFQQTMPVTSPPDLSGIVDTISQYALPIGAAAAVYFLFFHKKRKRRR